MRKAALFALVVLPGASAVLVCGYYLFQDWGALISAFGRVERAVAQGGDRALAVAFGLDSVYRINCFADGVGVMLGAILFAIGVHGLCVMPSSASPRGGVSASPLGVLVQGDARGKVATGAAGIVLVLVTLLLLGHLGKRVGETNALRRAIIRGDVASLNKQIAAGADVEDGFWWGSTPLELAQAQADPVNGEQVVAVLQQAAARGSGSGQE